MKKKSSGYLDLTNEEQTAFQDLHGGELARKFGSDKFGSPGFSKVVSRMEKSKGAISPWTMITNDIVPGWVYPWGGNEDLVNTMGVQLRAGENYPQPIKYNSVVVFDSKQPQERLLSTIDHELQHAKNARENGVGDNQLRGYVPAFSTAGRHFAQDVPAQMFPYEGRAALSMMLDRMAQIGKKPNPWRAEVFQGE